MPKSTKIDSDPTSTARITSRVIVDCHTIITNKLVLLSNAPAQEAIAELLVPSLEFIKLMPSEIAGRLIGSWYGAITGKIGRTPFNQPMVEVVYRMAELGFKMGRIYERNRTKPEGQGKVLN